MPLKAVINSTIFNRMLRQFDGDPSSQAMAFAHLIQRQGVLIALTQRVSCCGYKASKERVRLIGP